MEARCQCGSVSFKTPLEEPLALYICHCDSCKRQTSSAFGTSAIFPRFDPPDNANLSCYARPTAKGPLLYCYFCQKCGTRLLHSTPAQAFVSVKGGCITGLDWSKAVHLYTRSAMVPIPEATEAQCAAALSDSEYEQVHETLDQPVTPESSAQESVSPSA